MKRYNLYLAEVQIQQLKFLAKQSGAGSYSELIRRAITHYLRKEMPNYSAEYIKLLEESEGK